MAFLDSLSEIQVGYTYNIYALHNYIQCFFKEVNEFFSGLDPTIVFYMGNNRSRDLDPSDAHFVDVLHTGAGILGQWGPSGHADFYINGGSSQPGCASDTIFSKYIIYII